MFAVTIHCDGPACHTALSHSYTDDGPGHEEAKADAVRLGWLMQGGHFCPHCVERLRAALVLAAAFPGGVRQELLARLAAVPVAPEIPF